MGFDLVQFKGEKAVLQKSFLTFEQTQTSLNEVEPHQFLVLRRSEKRTCQKYNTFV